MDRRTPFDELDRLFEQMQENFENAAELWDPDAVETGVPTTAGLRIDLEDRGDELVLTGDLPGFETADIDVRVDDRTLHVSAERDEETDMESQDGEFVRRERRHSSVSRSVSLPTAVDTAEITATHDNGILTVRMPKADPDSEGTRIDVN
ncbi:Hsp20/alpha crystallin family protein [Haloplanus salilacus]|uniref:Hsp20/alpha crystallin family protein n=1 Tax=Haloplanus salilacus TaxID=2949994 RepID=UPI0030D1A619